MHTVRATTTTTTTAGLAAAQGHAGPQGRQAGQRGGLTFEPEDGGAGSTLNRALFWMPILWMQPEETVPAARRIGLQPGGIRSQPGYMRLQPGMQPCLRGWRRWNRMTVSGHSRRPHRGPAQSRPESTVRVNTQVQKALRQETYLICYRYRRSSVTSSSTGPTPSATR